MIERKNTIWDEVNNKLIEKLNYVGWFFLYKKELSQINILSNKNFITTSEK